MSDIPSTAFPPIAAPGTARHVSYVLPSLGRFYQVVAEPAAWLGFRALVGGALIYAGYPKILSPFGMSAVVESAGFTPGTFWSPFLAYLQFIGGIAIVIGFLTRPFALANAVMLAITLYFHMTHPYGASILTDAGREFFRSDGAQYLTRPGALRLAGGGGPFLRAVQDKAEYLSAIWTGAAFFFAAHGGGRWSVDRSILKREV